MSDAVGAGGMTDGGTTDTTLAVIVAVGGMMGTREAMRTRAMAERTLAADIAVERASAVGKASMVEEASTAVRSSTVAAGSMEVDAGKR